MRQHNLREAMIYFSVGALAAAALMLESTLTRLLAVAQFYHFAFLVVSLALLGFGASGSILSLLPNLSSAKKVDAKRKLVRILTICSVGFSLSVVAAYTVVNYLPFDSYSIAWDRRQLIYFGLYYVVLTIPFIFAGIGIGSALTLLPGKGNLVYAVNLFGSAIGIALALIIMQIAGVPGALLVSGIVGLVAISGFVRSTPKLIKIGYWGFIVTGGIFLAIFIRSNMAGKAPVGLTVSPYKGLAYAIKVPGSERLFGAWNAISRLDLISGASTRVLPGLSYLSPYEPPEQIGISADGDALLPVTLISPENFKAADYLPESVALHLVPNAHVLVIEPVGGLGILQALAGGARQVTAQVSNPLLIDALQAGSQEFNIFNHEQVKTLEQSARTFLKTPGENFDLIFVPLVDPYRPVASGAYSLNETYDLTRESFAAMINRLNEGGILMATRWLQTPPSEAIRLLTTLVEAMQSVGIDSPGEKVLAYRSIQTMTIVVKPDGWDRDDLARAREFIDSRRFDLVWAPDVSVEEVNKYNKLPNPEYYLVIKDLLEEEDKGSYYSGYSFDIRPATDDHPFFFHFFKWEQSPQIMASLGLVWQPFGGSGYFVLIALLLLVIGLSLMLILLPIIIKRHSSLVIDAEEPGCNAQISKWRAGFYFGSIGLAFLFIEIPLIQRSILSFEHPTYSFTFIVLVLLVYSSIGSLFSSKAPIGRKWLLSALFILVIITPILLNQVQNAALGWPIFLRAIAFGLIMAPMGILMGVPFPSGLEWLEERGTRLTPWAWAVNGCASVIAAVLAAILALSFGFTMVLLLGAGFYGIATLVIES